MINESCHLSSKVEIMVSICLIAPYKINIETDYSLELFYDFNGFQLLFPALFWLFGRGLGCCFGDFCDFSYFFLLFSSFLGGVGMLFGEFLRFQLLFPALFKLFGWVWGAVLEILGITAPQGPLAMLPTYGYCTL